MAPGFQGMDYLKSASLAALAELKSRHRLRSLSSPGPYPSSGNRAALLAELEEVAEKCVQSCPQLPGCQEPFHFQSNDYLAMGRRHLLDSAASRLAASFPVGSWSSRLLAGNHEIFEILEAYFSRLVNLPSTLYVGSGYAANEILPQVLAFPDVAFFSDSANHASLIDGIRLTKVPKERRHVFPHLQYDQLEVLLQQSTAACNVIFCEALYSMDGDFADLHRLDFLAERYRGILVIDEAHSFGVYGHGGTGCLGASGVALDRCIAVYTCGKALATQGAFISGPEWLRPWIINRGRSFIFTTAPSPLLAAVTYVALELMAAMEQERQNLLHGASLFRDSLRELGWDLGASASHILPVIVGTDARALNLAAQLANRGIGVSAIRPPTVPEGRSRVRMSLHAGLSPQNWKDLVTAFQKREEIL